ncbi:MAG: N-6 DNA methylase [Clostridiales bacterium]|jgi:hypothetical protein|nr:N-6 DNA methylase [Clostridiales bacterium]MCI1961252.1 N-6 DNA methylase [Clostridiales bacterium]MCI2021693.1 N-6 DNA methylase [Clostridiales bacterium]MCI2026480.1 N-6 DNA methylase [Clostridiales bacterium]
MNTKKIIKDLCKYSTDASIIEQMLVYSFIKLGDIPYHQSAFLSTYIADLDAKICEEAYEYISTHELFFSLSDLVEFFELLVPSNKKKETGVVYTPYEIKDYIVKRTLTTSDVPLTIDPACGCGSFLVTAVVYMHTKYQMSYREIISRYIYGVDIDANAIRKAKILLTLLACKNSEFEDCNFNLLCADMLNPRTFRELQRECPTGFNCVIGNPPYVRFRNMSEKSKKFLHNWETSAVGNVDLYTPFFEIGLKLLQHNGKLGFITPNGYIQSVNGRRLRTYFSSNNHSIEIIDFRDAQVFKNVTSYTCITLIDKGLHTGKIRYARLNEGETLRKHNVSEYNMGSFSQGAPWRMRGANIDSVIEKLESAGRPLTNWKIRNGLATLMNDLYFFTPDKEDDRFFYRTYKRKKYKIEKSICIKVAKPNIIKDEQELSQKTEIAIFPYVGHNNVFSVIEESVLKKEYPETYRMLCDYKEVLAQRDKGHGNYPVWYAYGRTQGMNNFGKKLLIPYIAGSPIAVLSLDENLLFYCGYALISDNERELRALKCFLESDAFWYYIFHTSKPYSKGYRAFAKNYIMKFSIPPLSDEEVSYLLTNPAKDELNQWIWFKYGISPQSPTDVIEKER